MECCYWYTLLPMISSTDVNPHCSLGLRISYYPMYLERYHLFKKLYLIANIYHFRQFLDPRRPSMTTPPEMREPGLPPYVPELVFPPEVILNYNQTLTRVQGIITAPTGLESTSVVLVYGLDLYCAMVNPSKGFDLLKDDFDYLVIASVLVGLTAAAYITRKMSQNKALKSAWK